MTAPWAWQDRAACRGEDPELFSGREGERQPQREIREAKAKAVCAGCPVIADCLAWALEHPQKAGDAVWGGMTGAQRRGERRRASRRGQAARRREAAA